ncbi:hypothetical protein BKA81DRAFT_196552 [Phyllosticta paracitricarpa]
MRYPSRRPPSAEISCTVPQLVPFFQSRGESVAVSSEKTRRGFAVVGRVGDFVLLLSVAAEDPCRTEDRQAGSLVFRDSIRKRGKATKIKLSPVRAGTGMKTDDREEKKSFCKVFLEWDAAVPEGARGAPVSSHVNALDVPSGCMPQYQARRTLEKQW